MKLVFCASSSHISPSKKELIKHMWLQNIRTDLAYQIKQDLLTKRNSADINRKLLLIQATKALPDKKFKSLWFKILPLKHKR